MRRHGNLWDKIVSFDNLLVAAQSAARGKRHVAGVARFIERIEPEVLALQRELQAGTYRPGRAYTFRIHDPKERTITAAPFRDRVVHHALIDPLEPLFDRRMVYESFACRKGKGTHAALRHAARLVRRYAFFFKFDVERCFDSIAHDVVMETLERILKDYRVLGLCETILSAGGRSERSGVGLPIGNLTSQWFANLVLDRLDHHVKERMRIPGYVRYMDDFVLFAGDRGRLVDARREVENFLAESVRLTLKRRATLLAPASQGLPFLGWRIHWAVTRLRPANLKRTRQRLKHRLWEYRTGMLSEDRLCDAVRSVAAHLEHGTTRALRRKMFDSLARKHLQGGGSSAPATA